MLSQVGPSSTAVAETSALSFQVREQTTLVAPVRFLGTRNLQLAGRGRSSHEPRKLGLFATLQFLL